MTFSCKPFYSLSLDELYEALALRSSVFVVEQNCVYQDLDFKDQKAYHCQIRIEGKLAAYTRIFNKNDSYEGYLSIGRVIVSPEFRTQGLGKELMNLSIEQCYSLFGKQPIKIGAQCYLHKFYTELGFIAEGDEYLEDGIPHQIMVKSV